MMEIIKKIGMIRNRNVKDDDGDDNNRKSTPRDKVVIKVFRANRIKGDPVRYDSFEVPVQRWTTVLDALIYAKSNRDSSIGIRYSCRMASCGSCGMKINGIPRLACYTIPNFPHIRDLVTDFSQFFNHNKEMKPYIHNENADIIDREKLSEFKQSPEDVDKYLQFSYCIRCGLCYSACPTVATDTKFPGPQALSQAYRYYADTRDNDNKERINIVDDRHGIWRCHFAGSCSVVCPKGVDPALGIQLLRGHLMGLSKNEKKIAKLENRSRN
jgi:succinate dehydrogenase / fumarate reductase iron-sulfur subunit